jgi:hypothetical protein
MSPGQCYHSLPLPLALVQQKVHFFCRQCTQLPCIRIDEKQVNLRPASVFDNRDLR